MPCFCGCERGGHKGNDDCFVERARRRRQSHRSGSRTAWSAKSASTSRPTAMQMHNSGASVTAIREAIEKSYAGAPDHTPTPHAEEGHGPLSSDGAMSSTATTPVAQNSPTTRSRTSSRPSTKASTSASSADAETATLAANPHLRLMFGWRRTTARRRRPAVRRRSLRRRSGARRIPAAARAATARCSDYLLRLRRVDGIGDVGRSHGARRARRGRPRRCASRR